MPFISYIILLQFNFRTLYNVDNNNLDINADYNNPIKCVNWSYFVGNFILLSGSL
jgi:hypothetical protein